MLRKITLYTYSCLLFSFLFLIFTKNAYAQSPTGVNFGEFPLFKRFSSLSALINVLLPNLLIFAGIVLLVYIVFAGFNMIRSAGSGDAEAAAKAKQALTYGIVGFVIIFSAGLVILLIEFLTGIPIFNPGF